MIVMERLVHTLPSVLRHQGGRLSPKQQRSLLDAWLRLDKAGILHNDSNPLNYMTDAQGHFQIIDYGMAKLLQRGRSNLISLENLIDDPIGRLSQSAAPNWAPLLQNIRKERRRM